MKKTGRRFMATLLAVIMVLCMIPVTASAEEVYSGECGDDMTWSFDEETSTLTISGTGDMWYYGFMSGRDVPWDFLGSRAKNLIIEDGITGISDSAFFGIGCNSGEIVIPDSVVYIGYDAFPADYIDESKWEDGVLYIGNHLIKAKNYISGDYTIKDGTVSIASEAFFRCKELSKVNIPNSVVGLGEGIFREVEKIESVHIPASVRVMDKLAFWEMDGLKKFSVDENSSYYSADEHGVLFNKDKTRLINYPVANEATKYVVPDTVKTIGYSAFRTAPNLIEVKLPESLVEIEDNAFYSCRNLAKVNLPNGLVSIGEEGFAYCDIEGTLSIPDSVTTIGMMAFYYCEFIERVEIGDGLTYIAFATFYECDSLKNVIVGNGVTTIEEEAFGAKLESIYIPPTVTQVTSASLGSVKTIYCHRGSAAGRMSVSTSTEKVYVDKITSVKLDAVSINLNVGGTRQLKTTIVPDKAINQTLLWKSSDDNIAKVDETGKVTAVSSGNCIITCKTTDGSDLQASCVVIVGKGAITKSLKITVDVIKWPVGKSSTFAPVITPAEASKKLAWTTSDAKVATISQSGKLTAVGVGTATITCKTTDGSNLEASCKVIVRQKGTELTKNVNITVDTIKWPIGKSSTFAPVVTPSNAQKRFIWTSSDPTVATVSQTGKLTAVGVGETTITCMATDGTNLFDTCKVIVYDYAKTESLKITVNTIKWPVGKTSTFAPVITPAEASKKLTWTTSDEKVATISQSGKLTAVGVGEATITCKTTDGSNLEASCKIIVRQKGTELTKNVNITVDTIKWPIGKSSTFAPVVTPSNAQKSFIWTSSDPTVATVSQTGKLTAVGVGETTITCMATDGTNLFDTCKVIVYDNNVKTESVKITVDVIKWPVGKASTFAPVITPEGASKKLAWTTSDEKVATISQSGKLTAVGVGEATITCKTTDGTNLESSCKVVVREKGTELTKNVNITVDTIKWPVGKSSTFAPFVYPSNSQKKFEWTSSDEKVATVSQTGKLTAVSVGEATITCKTIDGTNLSDTCKVIVYDNNAKTESLKITVDVIKWPVGKVSTFAPEITPEGASKKLIWTTSDEKVATISQSGKLTAVGVGVATITCKTTDGSNLEASCKIYVREKNTSLTSAINITVDTIRWPVGKSSTFAPEVYPRNAQKIFEWTTSDEKVATISQTGKLTAVGPGEAKITCKAIDGSEKKDTCKVIVSNKFTQVKFAETTLTLEEDSDYTLTTTFAPEDASHRFLSWTSTNEYVAEVTNTGKITAREAGTTDIVCKATDGSNLIAICRLVVTDRQQFVNYRNLYDTYFKDGTYAINTKVDYVDEDGCYLYSSKIQLGVDGIDSYMYELNLDEGQKLISGPDGTAMLLPQIKLGEMITEEEAKVLDVPLSYLNTVKNYYIELDDQPLHSAALKDLTYLSERTYTIDGVSYTIETFGSGFVKISFYFDNGNLCYIELETDSGIALLEVTDIQDTINFSEYKIPSGYTKLDIPLE